MRQKQKSKGRSFLKAETVFRTILKVLRVIVWILTILCVIATAVVKVDTLLGKADTIRHDMHHDAITSTGSKEPVQHVTIDAHVRITR
jgi:predicted anti-sigma-YlaC factor YlaD